MNMYGGQVDMYGNPMDMYGGQVDMYGNPVDMYGNPIGMDMNMNMNMYGNQQMGIQIGAQPMGGINMGNTMHPGQLSQMPTQQQMLINPVRSTTNAAPSEFRNTPSLESNSMTAKPTSKKLLEQMNNKKDSKEPYTWEFFHAASNNNVKRLNELLELGVFVNQSDVDTGNTALHMAAQKGQKHALFFLVDQGADVCIFSLMTFTLLHKFLFNFPFSTNFWENEIFTNSIILI